MDTCNVLDIVIERQILFYIYIKNHPNEIVRNMLRNSLLCYSSYCTKNINICINRLNVTLEDMMHSTKNTVKGSLKRLYPSMDWRTAMVEELLNAKDGVNDLGLSNDEINLILNDICFNNL